MTIRESGPYGFGAAFPARPRSLQRVGFLRGGLAIPNADCGAGPVCLCRPCPRLAQIPYTEFHATRVYLFGSLTRGSARETSDIDLAVEGLDPQRYREACARLEHATAVPVDLIDLADAPKTLIQRVQEEGVVLRERFGPR